MRANACMPHVFPADRARRQLPQTYLPREPPVNDYDLLRDYLKKQKLPEFVLSFEQIEEIIDAALPRAAHRASWWETERSPQEKMPQREACLEGGYIATRQADGKSVRFKRVKAGK
jgi:hypothetical protein